MRYIGGMQNVEIIYNCDPGKFKPKQMQRFVRFCMTQLDIPCDTFIRIIFTNVILRDGAQATSMGLVTMPEGTISATNPYVIEIKAGYQPKKSLAHELVHVDQNIKGRLRYVTDSQTNEHTRVWKGSLFDPAKYRKYQNQTGREWTKKDHRRYRKKQPWEREAFKLSAAVCRAWRKHKRKSA